MSLDNMNDKLIPDTNISIDESKSFEDRLEELNRSRQNMDQPNLISRKTTTKYS